MARLHDRDGRIVLVNDQDIDVYTVGPGEVKDGSGLGPGDLNYADQEGVEVSGTDTTFDTGIGLGRYSRVIMGRGYVPSKGRAHSWTGDMIVQGCGDQLSEYALYYGWMTSQIGTGFPQSAGPAGRYWFTDYKLSGPIGVQPHLLNGITMLVNNHYNGSPISTPSAGLWIVTKEGLGDIPHVAAATFPMDYGIGISGVSTGNGRGFTTGMRIGGAGSGWGTPTSRFGTALEVRDFDSRGIYVSAKYVGSTPLAAIEVASGAGDLVLSGIRIVVGSGSPEGVVTAPVGSQYHRTDGGAGTSMYVKESGAGNTGWVAK